ncbi:hypothetical protein D3C73_1369620 [compost metagenome]
MNKAHAIRAGGDAILATDAQIRVHIHNAGGSIAIRCPRRADVNTGGVIAVLARMAEEAVLHIRKRPQRLAANNRQTRYAFRHVVHFPTGIHAGGTADA